MFNLRNKFWFLPTKEKQIEYRKEELGLINKEKVKATGKMILFSDKSVEVEKELLSTFSLKQRKLYHKLKGLHQKSLFWKNHINYSEKRLNKIPSEIEELNK